MLKIAGRTSHQLDALEREGLPTERRTASTVTLPSFTTWAEFAAWTTETRARAKAGTSFYYESGKLATEAADLSDGDPARRERVEKSLRRGHLTALASLDRYAQEQAGIERETPDAKTREKLFNKSKKAQAEREKRRATKGQLCHCGCGGTTGGGKYLPGHDARHKSALIKAVLASEVAGEDEPGVRRAGTEALAVLEQKGWTKFLDKAREVAARPKADPRVARAERRQNDEERARRNIERLNLLKAAAARLKELDRYSKKDGHRMVPVTYDTAQAIVDDRFDYEAWDKRNPAEPGEITDYIKEQ